MDLALKAFLNPGIYFGLPIHHKNMAKPTSVEERCQNDFPHFLLSKYEINLSSLVSIP